MGKPIEFDHEDMAVSEILRLITEIEADDIQKIFEGFCFYFALQYLEKENIRIPFIGDLTFKDGYIIFKSHDNLKKLMKQLNDSSISGRVMDIDLMQMLQNKIKKNLKENDAVKIEL